MGSYRTFLALIPLWAGLLSSCKNLATMPSSAKGEPVPHHQTVAENRYAQVSVGYDHACATLNGALYCWGNNNRGQLGFSPTSEEIQIHKPMQVLKGILVTKVAAGEEITCAQTQAGKGMKGKQALCWGNSSTLSALLNLNPWEAPKSQFIPPTVVPGLESWVTDIDVSRKKACAIREGRVACWGKRKSLTLVNRKEHPNTQISWSTYGIDFDGINWISENSLNHSAHKIYVGGPATCAIVRNVSKKADELWCWDGYRQEVVEQKWFGDWGYPLPPEDSPYLKKWDDYMESMSDKLAQLMNDPDKDRKAWEHYKRALPLPNILDATPMKIPLPGHPIHVGYSAHSTCVYLKTKNEKGSTMNSSHGEIKCWGQNSSFSGIPSAANSLTIQNSIHGEIDPYNESTYFRRPTTPIWFDFLSNDIESFDLQNLSFSNGGGRNQCLILSNNQGTYCWGDNQLGQLGIGSTSTPSQIKKRVEVPTSVLGEGLRFLQISVGYQQTCAVHEDRKSIYCWGLFEQPPDSPHPKGRLTHQRSGWIENRPIKVLSIK